MTEDNKPVASTNKWADLDLKKDVAEELDQPVLTHATPEELLVQVTELENKLDESEKKALHCLADMENLRRRHERERVQEHKYGVERFAKELLQVVDNLERALAQKCEEDNALWTGVELTWKHFQSVLDKFAIKAIDPLDKTFDPNLHEAMAAQEDSEKAPGTVLTVLQKGYQLHDRLLRPALVVVVKAKETEKNS